MAGRQPISVFRIPNDDKRPSIWLASCNLLGMVPWRGDTCTQIRDGIVRDLDYLGYLPAVFSVNEAAPYTDGTEIHEVYVYEGTSKETLEAMSKANRKGVWPKRVFKTVPFLGRPMSKEAIPALERLLQRLQPGVGASKTVGYVEDFIKAVKGSPDFAAVLKGLAESGALEAELQTAIAGLKRL